MPNPIAVLWRQGRKQPRAIYARIGGGDWEADMLIGYLDTGELAAEAVQAHNEALAARWQAANEMTVTEGGVAGTAVKVLAVLRMFNFSGWYA